MKLLSTHSRPFIGMPLIACTENLHVRLLNKWMKERNTGFLHPQCNWHVAEGHPYPGFYPGRDFYGHYTKQITDNYQSWNEEVNRVIGSQIGGIVVGNYHFQHKMNGLWYTAPFTHFYQIHQGQICGVRFFIGDVRHRVLPFSPIPERAVVLNFF